MERRYLLDTNVCVRYLNGRVPTVLMRLQRTPVNLIFVCSVVRSELLYGAHRSKDPQRTLRIQQQFLAQFVSLPFDDQAADTASHLRAILATQGTPVGPYDLQIAATAIVHNLVLVTHNIREFHRVPGLITEDWELSSAD